jgi:hypothetical protein
MVYVIFIFIYFFIQYLHFIPMPECYRKLRARFKMRRRHLDLWNCLLRQLPAAKSGHRLWINVNSQYFHTVYDSCFLVNVSLELESSSTVAVVLSHDPTSSPLSADRKLSW